VRPLRVPPRPLDAAPNRLDEHDLPRFFAFWERENYYWFAFFFLDATTGMRPGEMAALDWPDLDESAHRIAITKNWRGKRHGMGPTKNGKPRQAPYLPAQIAVMREHRRRMIEAQHPGLDSGAVFPGQRLGLRLSTNAIGAAIRTAAKALGIPYLTPKSMRRTFNDLLRIAGVHEVVLRSIVGHRRDAEDMTDTYSTVDGREQRAALAAVLRLIGKPDTGPDTAR